MLKQFGAQVEITNLAPHDIVIYDQAGEKVLHVFPTSGKVARVLATANEQHVIQRDGFTIPVVTLDYGEIEGLDGWNGDDPILVSAIVADALKKEGHTYGVYYPDTGPGSVVRDAEGNILGVKRLAILEE